MPDHKPTNPTGKNGRRQWTAADTDRMRQLHADGMTCNGIAREMGFNPAVISRRCRELGLKFDRSPVEAANVARRADARAKRLELIAACYEEAFEVLAHRRTAQTGSYKRVFKGQYGSEETGHEIDFVPPNEWRDLSATMAQFINVAARLEAVDSDAGLTSARSMLGALAEAIGLKPTDDA